MTQIKDQNKIQELATKTRDAFVRLEQPTSSGNKFWEIAKIDKLYSYRRWGRIGNTGSERYYQHVNSYDRDRVFNQMVSNKKAKGYQVKKSIGNSVSPSELLKTPKLPVKNKLKDPMKEYFEDLDY